MSPTAAPARALAIDDPAIRLLGPVASAADCDTLLTAARRGATDATRFVVLVTDLSPDLVAGALVAGAHGVLGADVRDEHLATALASVAAGSIVFDARVESLLVNACIGLTHDTLSMRERDVLVHLAEGATNAEIAARLYVSTETVKTHVAHLLRKLGVANRAEATAKAHRLGLVGTSTT